MSEKALEDDNYELMKAHILNPDEALLSKEKNELLNRVISASRILDINPLQNKTIALHMQKYTDITLGQAYRDIRLAARLYSSLNVFDYDYWCKWLINDIVRNIQRCENRDNPEFRRVISMEHSNLIRAVGEKPEDLPDASRNEKHQFYILVQNNNQQIKIDINKLKDLPVAALQELNKAIWGGQEITEATAEEIMKT